jgi:EAL domain-containing protein (putative c-di-GMP-specific phosphodiesterase class I)
LHPALDHAELGEISHADALAAAEAEGLVREVTWWLFNNAFRQHAEFGDDGIELPVSICAARRRARATRHR